MKFKKKKLINKIIGGVMVTAPLTATIVACGTDSTPNASINDDSGNIQEEFKKATNWLKNLSWSFAENTQKLNQETFNHQWFLSKTTNHPLGNFDFSNIMISIPQQGVELLPTDGIAKITYQLSINETEKTTIKKTFSGWKNTTAINGDLSNLDITSNLFSGVDLSKVKKWPQDLSGIDWTGAIKLGQEGGTNPFVGDISNLTIRASKLNGVDVSQVTKWPEDLSHIDWTGVINLTSANTPFKGDISEFSDVEKKETNLNYKNIIFNDLNGVDVSQVEKWPADLNHIDWTGVVGLSPTKSEKNPFWKDISTRNITGSKLNGVDVSQVEKWPTELTLIDWTGVVNLNQSAGNPFNNITSPEKFFYNITYNILSGVDVSQLTKWPIDLTGIDWTGIVGLTTTNTPFKDNIITTEKFAYDITYSTLNGVDVTQLTKWPTDLTGIDWTGVVGLTTNTPFKDDISSTGTNLTISYNKLNSVDVGQVETWPTTLTGINWTGVVGLTTANTPFSGNISELLDAKNNPNYKNIYGNTLNGVDVSGVTTWPINLTAIDWTGAIKLGQEGGITPFVDDISNLTIIWSTLNGIDVSQVETWPTDLNNIDWTGAQGLNSINTPFKGDISSTGTNLTITSNTLNGVDVSGVTKWPEDLNYIDWTGVLKLGQEGGKTPFINDISKTSTTPHTISGSTLNGVDVSQVTKWWPFASQHINWNGVKWDESIIF